jgi:hypothetical protein
LLAAMSTAEGFYPPEIMGNPPRAAAWIGPRATIELPVASGVIGLEMMASRPSPAEVEIRVGSATAHLLVGPQATRVELPVPSELERGGLAHLEIRSTTFVPGPTDQRALGIAVSRVWYLPETTAPGNRS